MKTNLIKKYLIFLGFETSGIPKYKKRCDAMLICSFLYYLLSALSVSNNQVAWFIILVLNMLVFLRFILENAINITIINDNINSQSLDHEDRHKIFYICKTFFEIGIFCIYTLYFIWNAINFLDFSGTNAPLDMDFIRWLVIILYLLLFYEDVEKILLVAYCPGA